MPASAWIWTTSRNPTPPCASIPTWAARPRISDDDYLEGAPELIGEVASSSASYDLGDKLRAYRRNGVREYVVWRVLDRAIDWFALREGTYQLLAADAGGICRSEAFPGLWLDVPAMLAGDLARVLDVLHTGLQTPEHAAFVERLRPRLMNTVRRPAVRSANGTHLCGTD